MNIFYEESGQFKVASVIQKNDSHYQADTQHGKRVKIKANHVFFEFEGMLDDLINAAQAEAEEIDIPLLWESVGIEEFTAQQAAEEYYGAKISKTQLAATLMALYAAPIYFYKKGKGVFKAATAEVLQQALTTAERKKQQEAQMNAWIAELVSGSLPTEIAADLASILHAPDKQSLTYKAFHKASETLKINHYELAKHIGGIHSLPEYLLQRFEHQYFPKGLGFPELPSPILATPLPTAEGIHAFSIDDLSTTEIDDALSVQDYGDYKRIGIHIAAPALAIEPYSEIEKVIFARQSTVYFPANKITMLPENWINTFSLDQGHQRPAVSIYFNVDSQYQLSEPETRIEWINIKHNLRIQEIEPFFNSEIGIGEANHPQFPHHADCLYLLELAYALQKQRDRFEEPSLPRKYDYGIDFDEQGKVVITRRERGSPIDTLVSEMMILANSTWASMLHQHQLSGLFRVQPSGRVRMSTHSEAHIGMNLAHYGWFTSPLRRACDYINQKQLQSLLIDGCSPRFKQQDIDLFSALTQFESTYSAYRDFQEQMEHYWALVWLEQQHIQTIRATVLKEDLVRLEGVPLVARATGIPAEMAPKTMIELAISEICSEQQLIALRYINVVSQMTE